MTQSLVYTTSHSEKDSVLPMSNSASSVSGCSSQTSKSRTSLDSSHAASECSSPTVAPTLTPKTASSDTLVAYDARKGSRPSTARLVVTHAG
ncbi:hypothetical protein LXA43DRAFT_876930 [Ganoderma leucocontextum]|nr:hypothetical protein LXA43DRAFT_876930 [Ganoderma leucocontextum]